MKSLFRRVRDLLRRESPTTLTLDTANLRVVAEAFDPAEADSAVLARARDWRAGEQAVLRHHLSLPTERVAEAARTLAQDGWELRAVPGAEPGRVHALRVQVLDALHCAQERSRMAGLAQRLGGDADGWDALQPGPGPTAQRDREDR